VAVVPVAAPCAATNGSNGSNGANGANGAGGASGANVAAARGAIDPVLGSVMSQFQLLQKDAARRRAQHAKNKAS
jgi:hypothetical protein